MALLRGAEGGRDELDQNGTDQNSLAERVQIHRDFTSVSEPQECLIEPQTF
jgi:hypothetical protein